jgi:hypothetical protein
MGGRDRLGVHGMKGGFPSDNENVSEDISKKKVQGNLKAKLVLTQNKNMFPTNKKTLIFEEKVEVQSDLLNEDNIKDNLDN